MFEELKLVFFCKSSNLFSTAQMFVTLFKDWDSIVMNEYALRSNELRSYEYALLSNSAYIPHLKYKFYNLVIYCKVTIL